MISVVLSGLGPHSIVENKRSIVAAPSGTCDDGRAGLDDVARAHVNFLRSTQDRRYEGHDAVRAAQRTARCSAELDATKRKQRCGTDDQ